VSYTDYRYPHRDVFYDDHLQYNRALFRYLVSPKHDDWEVVVADHQDRDNCAKSIVAAFGVRNTFYVNLRKHGSSYPPQNRKPRSLCW
jgi:hypothetical protein